MTKSPKRFYAEVTVKPAEGGFLISLDDREIRTPGRRPIILSLTLAEAVAAEWRAQGERIDLAVMPIARLANAMIDHVGPRMTDVRKEALAFARSDLLCCRAEAPAALRERQDRIWQPPLDWLARRHGVLLPVFSGIIAEAPKAEDLERLEAATMRFDVGRLLVWHALTTRFGSAVLALAVLFGEMGASDAFEASRLDEIFQAEKWGEDAEAMARVKRIGAEIADLERFLKLLSAAP